MDWLTSQFNVLINIVSLFPPVIDLAVTKCRGEDSP